MTIITVDDSGYAILGLERFCIYWYISSTFNFLGILKFHSWAPRWHIKDLPLRPANQGCSPRPTPPRKKQALPRPARRNWQNLRGKLTVNSKIKIWYPFSLCPQISSERRKKKKKLTFDPVYSLWLDLFSKKSLLKKENESNVFL